MGGGLVVDVAAEDPRVAAVVAIVPHLDGTKALPGTPVAARLRLLATAIADARVGAPFVVAFGGIACRTSLPALARFVDGITVALQRGTPLAIGSARGTLCARLLGTWFCLLVRYDEGETMSAAGCDAHADEREGLADERERLADAREDAQDRRDRPTDAIFEAADLRDAAASARDRAARLRDGAGRERDVTAAEQERNGDFAGAEAERRRGQQDRSASLVDRDWSARDRDYSAGDRADLAAQTRQDERAADQQQRADAASERQAAAFRRRSAPSASGA